MEVHGPSTYRPKGSVELEIHCPGRLPPKALGTGIPAPSATRMMLGLTPRS